MNKIKAVVLEKSGFRYTVLDKDGAFRRIHKRQNAEVGEEIEIQVPSMQWFGEFRALAGVAALFFLVLTTIFAWNLYQAPTAVALLSVDINPSIQFTIDDQGNLLKINSKNEDAEGLLKNIDFEGRPLDSVLEEFVIEAYNQSYLKPEQSWIVVGYSPLSTNPSVEVEEKLNEERIMSWLRTDFEEKGFTPQVAIFAVTAEDRELALKENLTLGEYALWQTAIQAGVDTPVEKLKDTKERVNLLENPKVQVQVNENKKDQQQQSVSSVKDSRPDKSNKKDAKNNHPKNDTENLNNNLNDPNEENKKNGASGDTINQGRDINDKGKEKEKVNQLKKDIGEHGTKNSDKGKEKGDSSLSADVKRNDQISNKKEDKSEKGD
ncbi:anti-sigma factor domain-containing protein [Desulfosporosinus sp. HMP52]|uniref:anti-sigma factor domain-containing protein n=1 Tax=Desulfosporosinus sp. HMP52 TaxID=1487923 RepID=UPI00068E1A2D|nr:anti-sigma factor domain-containing protein [Desulfosporosinus sp. HMP52]